MSNEQDRQVARHHALICTRNAEADESLSLLLSIFEWQSTIVKSLNPADVARSKIVFCDSASASGYSGKATGDEVWVHVGVAGPPHPSVLRTGKTAFLALPLDIKAVEEVIASVA